MDPWIGLGQFIRNRRKELGMSQRELATRVGISGGYMSQIESGDRKWPQKHVATIAEALNVTEIELVRAAGMLSYDDRSTAFLLRAGELGATIPKDLALKQYSDADEEERGWLYEHTFELLMGCLAMLLSPNIRPTESVMQELVRQAEDDPAFPPLRQPADPT